MPRSFFDFSIHQMAFVFLGLCFMHSTAISQQSKDSAGKSPVEIEGLLGYSKDGLESLIKSAGSAEGLSDRGNRVLFSRHAGDRVGVCRFPSEVSTALQPKITSQAALLVPVYRLRDAKYIADQPDTGLEPDWPATERLHAQLVKQARLRLLPIVETRRFDQEFRSHVSETLKYHYLAIGKSLGSDGGLFGMLKNFGAGSDASNANEQLAGPFNMNYNTRVISKFPEASYVVSSSDATVITAYFSSLLVYLGGGQTKFPVPSGADLTSVKVVKSIWESYLASYGFLLGTELEGKAEGASVNSATRLVKIIGSGLVQQWKVLGPELAVTGAALDAHAGIRSKIVGYLSISPIEVFSSMTSLGYISTKLQCNNFQPSTLTQLSEVGAKATEIWAAIDKESNPLLGSMVRDMVKTNDGRGCVGWGCDRSNDQVRISRFNEMRESMSKLMALDKSVDYDATNNALVESLVSAMGNAGLSGAQDSQRLK